jgi:hypothetical protein
MSGGNKQLTKGRTMTTDELNAAAKIIGTTDKNTVFAMCVKTLIDAGFDHETAFDRVLGAGSYEKFAGNLYDALRGN